MNVFADGANEVADRLVTKVRANRKQHWLWVMPNGAYRIEYREKKWRDRADRPGDECIVGLYTTASTHKQVRQDIEERMKEIRA